MFRQKPAIEYGVIGLGLFGTAIATRLSEAGKDVLVIDSNESKIKQIRNLTENAFVVGEITKEVLQEVGIQNCGTVIVCIGEKIDVSILTTLNVLSLGVPRVLAKAYSPEQGQVLEKIGAEVIYPEQDMATRLANRLISSRVMDYISLDNNINISEFKLTDKLSGKTVLQVNLRQRFKLNIIAIMQNNTTITEITPDLVLNENDVMVVIGKKNNLKKFEDYLIK